ncbi:MAG: hypothetical protein K6U89_02295 [Chloroflexi bacterium]|nr:hypothetical protein [Chloroflexota bacterium]
MNNWLASRIHPRKAPRSVGAVISGIQACQATGQLPATEHSARKTIAAMPRKAPRLPGGKSRGSRSKPASPESIPA